MVFFDIATLDILRFISAVGAVNLDMKCLAFSFLVYHELKCGPNNFDGTTAWCNGWVLCEALFILVPQLLRRPVFLLSRLVIVRSSHNHYQKT